MVGITSGYEEVLINPFVTGDYILVPHGSAYDRMGALFSKSLTTSGDQHVEVTYIQQGVFSGSEVILPVVMFSEETGQGGILQLTEELLLANGKEVSYTKVYTF